MKEPEKKINFEEILKDKTLYQSFDIDQDLKQKLYQIPFAKSENKAKVNLWNKIKNFFNQKLNIFDFYIPKYALASCFSLIFFGFLLFGIPHIQQNNLDKKNISDEIDIMPVSYCDYNLQRDFLENDEGENFEETDKTYTKKLKWKTIQTTKKSENIDLDKGYDFQEAFFEELGWEYFIDEKNIYYLSTWEQNILKWTDYETFVFLYQNPDKKWFQHFAKDKNFVYNWPMKLFSWFDYETLTWDLERKNCEFWCFKDKKYFYKINKITTTNSLNNFNASITKTKRK